MPIPNSTAQQLIDDLAYRKETVTHGLDPMFATPLLGAEVPGTDDWKTIRRDLMPPLGAVPNPLFEAIVGQMFKRKA